VRIRSKGESIYQLKVSLAGARPPIWRRFLVPARAPLARLHEALQLVMGWCDAHLHQFEAKGVTYGVRDRETGSEVVSEAKTTIDQLLRRPKDRLRYIYDFGDNWQHDVVLEKVLPPDPGVLFPQVLAGKRACSPEDTGGLGGYSRLVHILSDPKHEEYRDMLEWVGKEFDPEAFDVRQLNLAIHGGWVLE
jgi:hypothetical protein